MSEVFFIFDDLQDMLSTLSSKQRNQHSREMGPGDCSRSISLVVNALINNQQTDNMACAPTILIGIHFALPGTGVVVDHPGADAAARREVQSGSRRSRTSGCWDSSHLGFTIFDHVMFARMLRTPALLQDCDRSSDTAAGVQRAS
jgi:hypothetical protein